MEDRRHLGTNVGEPLIHVHGSSGDLGPIEESNQSEQASQPSFFRIAFLMFPFSTSQPLVVEVGVCQPADLIVIVEGLKQVRYLSQILSTLEAR
jgi:hypothetical protein